jgi:hypothetical protein
VGVKPVMQTRFGRPLGNCWAAAIASILEVPLEAVDWAVGMTAEEVEPNGPDADVSKEWIRRQEESLKALGYWMARGIPAAQAALLPPDVHYLMLGNTPGGIGHVVVGRGGEIVHDSNPESGGLAVVEELVLLVRR